MAPSEHDLRISRSQEAFSHLVNKMVTASEAKPEEASTPDEKDTKNDLTWEGKDRRRTPRRYFPYLQYVAPLKDRALPPPDAYQQVRFRDLSKNGFSFLANEEPKVSEVIAALGTGSHLTYVIAEIIRVNCLSTGDSPIYLVGCRIRARIAIQDFGNDAARESSST